ncbi:MAG: hypothetical protein HYY24_12615 [Verrucomicrobia bacterium]|nr:hypothetical protein [Verrucomicrobiota bacterium]
MKTNLRFRTLWFCSLLSLANLAQGQVYLSENFDTLDTAGLVAKGWDLNKNEFALETGADFGVAVPPYAAENFPSGSVPGGDFNDPLSGERLVAPPTANGTASTGGFLISDSDAAGGSDNIGSKSEFWATTPSFNTTGSTEAWFHADADIEVNNNGECIVDLQASVDGGQTWILAWGQAEPQRPIKSYNYEPNEPGFEGSTPIGGYPVFGSASQTKTWSGIHGRWHVKLPAEVNNKPNVKLRIRYYEPADAWWIALDNVVVDNSPPPQGKDVVLAEAFENGIPATWKNTAVVDNKWGTEPLKDVDGKLLRHYGPAEDPIPLNIDILREAETQRANGLNLPADAFSRFTVKDMTDFPDLVTFHPNAYIDGRFMMMLAGGKYALWQNGEDTTEVATLDTPTLDLSTATAAFIDFDSEWLDGDSSVLYEVYVSTDGGANFSRILSYQSALSDRNEASYFMHHYLEVPAAAGKNQVVFRFQATGGDPGAYEGFWVIDNVRVTANKAAAAGPGKPEDNGLPPKTDTFYINTPDTINNTKTESLGVAIANNGNVIIGWEDDGADLADLEAVWTLFNSSGTSLTPDTEITTIDPNFAGQTLTSKFLSFFRSDGSAISGRTSWGPKIKANLFGDGIGMGATAFDLGVEVTELAAIQFNAVGENAGDFPAVQLLSNSGQPVGSLSGLSDADAEPAGNVRIGDWEYLSNGNIVIVGESRQKDDAVTKYGGSAPAEHAIYRIVDPTGKEVKATGLVSETPEGNANIWHGVGVTANGFAVRFSQGGAKVRIFDNAGNPVTGNIDLAALTGKAIASGGGRGDGAGFHGNGKDAYVAINSGTDEAGAKAVWVTVLNADGTLRYTRSVADDLTGDVALTNADRVDAAIDSSGRVLAVFDDAGPTAGVARIVMGRLFDPTGQPLGGTFYVSEKESPDLNPLESRQPRAAWRGGLAVVVWQSQNQPDALGTRTVAARYFSTFKPGSIESVGLTRIVADTPIINQGLDKLGNWEPYISVLGNSTFLLEGNAFALGADNLPDGVNQRYVVALQPAAGGAMKLGEGFFADNGTPFKGQINLSRQNGNPGRVAGDTRPGAVNFMVGGEASPHGLPEFQAEPDRWNLGFARAADARYGTVQIYSLDPATLTQNPLTKALDAINGRLTTGDASGISQLGRFGGDLACLDNGNFVVAVDDRSQVRDPANSTTAVIIAPDGTIVKESFLVEPRDIWSNVAAHKGGFVIRVHQNLHFFDNNGELKGTVDQATSGEGFDAGRGDGTRIAGHINSPYVFLAGKVAGANLVKVAVWDSRDRSFVSVAIASEPAFSGDFDRVNLAVDALNRVTVSWVSKPAGYEQQQVAARVLALNEGSKTIVPLTASFLPFINAAQTGGIRTLQMSVAMTTKQICIAAKGEINLENKPELGAVINPLTGLPQSEINFYTVFTHPDPQDDPTPPVGGPVTPIAIGKPVVAAGKVNLVWAGGQGPFTVQKKAKLTDASWTDVLTTPDRAASVNLEGDQGFVRVVGR